MYVYTKIYLYTLTHTQSMSIKNSVRKHILVHICMHAVHALDSLQLSPNPCFLESRLQVNFQHFSFTEPSNGIYLGLKLPNQNGKHY